MTKDTKMSWFKGIRSVPNEIVEEKVTVQAEPEPITPHAEDLETVTENTMDEERHQDILTKEGQDKIALDVIVSLEKLLNDRQLTKYENEGLEDQLHTATETIHRLKHDLVNKEQLIQNKGKEIRTLETTLTNKQMSYDQLLEDFKAYQSNAAHDFEKISNQLDKETDKYNMLKEESSNTQYQNLLHIQELEEKVRELEIENQKSMEEQAKILKEKAELMQTINDFTERMSFSFSSNTDKA